VLAVLGLILTVCLPLQPVELGLPLLVALRLVLLAILARLVKRLPILALLVLVLLVLVRIHQGGPVLLLLVLVQQPRQFWHLLPLLLKALFQLMFPLMLRSLPRFA
jgi:hypothetical protein